MFKKTNWPLVVSGVVAVALIGVLLGRQYWPKNSGVAKKFFGDGQKFCINKICLFRENKEWLVESGQVKIPANQEVADIYWKHFGEIKLEDVVSNNQARFVELGIGSTDPVVIKIGDKKLEIGNVALTTSGTYVREMGDKIVYKIPEILDRTSLVKVEQWQIRQITNLPVYQIKKVVLTGGATTKTLEPKDGKWENQKLVDRVAYLAVLKFLPDFTDQNSKTRTITVTTENEDVEVVLGKKKRGKEITYWASTDNKWFYEISTNDYFDLTGEG